MRVDLSVRVGDGWPDWFRGTLLRREGRIVSFLLTDVQKRTCSSCQETPPQTDNLIGGDSWAPHQDLQLFGLTFEGVNSFDGLEYASSDKRTRIVVFWKPV